MIQSVPINKEGSKQFCVPIRSRVYLCVHTRERLCAQQLS